MNMPKRACLNHAMRSAGCGVSACAMELKSSASASVRRLMYMRLAPEYQGRPVVAGSGSSGLLSFERLAPPGITIVRLFPRRRRWLLLLIQHVHRRIAAALEAIMIVLQKLDHFSAGQQRRTIPVNVIHRRAVIVVNVIITVAGTGADVLQPTVGRHQRGD